MLPTLVALLLAAQQAEPSSQPRDLGKSLQVAAYVYFPDGHTVATWHDRDIRRANPFSDDIFTIDTLCVFENHDVRLASASYGWHIDMRPVRQTENQLVVQVDWRRVRDRNQDANGPSGSVQMTLRPGDRVPLDYIVPGPPPEGRSCKAIGMSFEILLGPVAGAPAPVPAGPARELTESDVWLVHRFPDGGEYLEALTLRGRIHQALDFVFKDTKTTTASGDAIVRIEGSLRTRPTGDGTLSLEVAVNRSLSTPQSRQLPPYWNSGGGLSTVTSAKLGEVLAFELPPIEEPSRAFKGHGFSIRVRPRVLGQAQAPTTQGNEEQVVLNFEIYKNGVLAAKPTLRMAMTKLAVMPVVTGVLTAKPARVDAQHVDVLVGFNPDGTVRTLHFTLNGHAQSSDKITIGSDVYEIRLSVGS